jgi:hypothetical protein
VLDWALTNSGVVFCSGVLLVLGLLLLLVLGVLLLLLLGLLLLLTLPV